MNNTPSGQGAGATVAAVLCVSVLILIPGPTDAKITLTEDIGDKQITLQFFHWSQFELRGGPAASERGGALFRAGFIRFGIDYLHGPRPEGDLVRPGAMNRVGCISRPPAFPSVKGRAAQ